MPAAVVDAAVAGNLVLFAGAGVSSESPTVYPWSLYEDVRRELHVRKKSYSFPELMEMYCSKPDGRKRLLIKIKQRLDYVNSFPMLRNVASMFHREVSKNYLLKDIIMTNWDMLFEEECGSIPIVTPDDFAFWGLPGRKVYKIHGSVGNVGTIVASVKDYDECYKRMRTGIVGSNLKMLLATKTVVFVGYSFRDYDFNRIYDYLKRELRELLPHAYFVSLGGARGARERCNRMTCIDTDGAYFVHVLNRQLYERGDLIDNAQRELEIHRLLRKLHVSHDAIRKLNIRKHPMLFYTYMYQDGLMDAFVRFNIMKRTGEYSNPGQVGYLVGFYKDRIDRSIVRHEYSSAAYHTGYLCGIGYFLADRKMRRKLSIYYVYGYDGEIADMGDLKKIIKSRRVNCGDALRFAKRELARMGIDRVDGVAPQYRPFL